VRKLPNKQEWKVINTETGKIHAAHTTLKNAKAQVRLLQSLKGGKLTAKETNQFVSASYAKKKDAQKVGDYKLDKELSTKKNKVYVNPKTKKVVVANAGTSSSSDWLNNVGLVTGTSKSTQRYKDVEKTQKKAIKKYGKENITNVGHSQSGSHVNEMAKKGLVKDAVVVNPALTKADKHVQVVRSSGDVVSALSSGKRKKTIKSESFNPLTEHSADILGRDPQGVFGRGKPRRRVDRSMIGGKLVLGVPTDYEDIQEDPMEAFGNPFGVGMMMYDHT